MYSKKSLCQNFLIDKNIIEKILNLVQIKNRNIIEIGPGKGSLTDAIIKKNPKNLILIEKDFFLAQKLKVKYSKLKKITVFNDDVLEFDIEKILKKDSIILGNLPYNISSQIIVKLIKVKNWPPKYKDIVFMFQKELGEKIIGKFKSKNYGRLSVLTNYRLNACSKFLVSPNCFSPKPKITSMVIHFSPKDKNKIMIRDLSNLENITNVFFSNKRKMINKNLKKIIDKKQIKIIPDLKCHLRPSDVRPETYYKITELYEKN